MEDFDLKMIPPVPREKLGPDFKLNRDTAKQLYFVEKCDLSFAKKPVLDWYEREFTKDELLGWNNEYAAKEIIEINQMVDEFLKKEPDFDALVEVEHKLYFLLDIIMTNDKVIYDAIELIKRFSKEIGDFYYSLLYFGGRDGGPYCLSDSIFTYLAYRTKDYVGIVCNLYKLEKKDLLNKLLDEYMIPLLIEGPVESEIMKKLDLKYYRRKYSLDPETQNETTLRLLKQYFKGTEFESKFEIDIKITY